MIINEGKINKRINELFVFVINIEGEEKIVTWPNIHGIDVPLVYLSQQEIEGDGMKKAIQMMADHRKIYFELRRYDIVESSVEKFYPAQEKYNA